MSALLARNRSLSPCDSFQEWLESTTAPAHAPETYESLLASAPAEVQAHAAACSDCRAAASDVVALRNLVRDLEPAPLAGPWFAPRVMAAIASQEKERSRVVAIWLAVPHFASQFSLVAAAALVFTCAWMYERPAAPAPQTASAFASEHLFDPPALPANHDDVLVSMNEKDQ